ncbi:tetratricopeptide repeat-containing protein 4 [Elsinoe australis]|uniref:Tetratricopeptide repeat-containing protein 4 n=1 Tax=Elsinoe australis TaxID=40998 RepID=A0A4U7B8R3_9PEZI|nr:tetratricopeptide repeat-containing protein 4 [Elsinoe australis]
MASAKPRTNGVNGHAGSPEPDADFARFSNIPPAMDIPVSSGDLEEAVEVDLEDLMDDPTELCTLLENEHVAKTYWLTIALAYAKQKKLDLAIDILNRGMSALSRTEDRLSMLSCLCWVILWQCREAPRLKPHDQDDAEVRLKDHFVQAATATLNDASRINPTYPPLFLARGVLYLLRAALLSTKSGFGPRAHAERVDMLQQATKCFEDALRSSGGRNIMAVMGKARTLFSLGKYAESYATYQNALERAPDMYEPDPRIGLGCCLWQLGHKEEAKTAWQRSLEVNKQSKIANVLLGLYHLDASAKYHASDPEFQEHYKTAMIQYNQTAYKMDSRFPLTCATFGNYFLLRKAWPTLQKLSRQAIDYTDVNAIASDGWYLLARKEHYENNVAEATDYYNRADQARGGDEKGYLPAKFGAAQLKVATNDLAGAKFRLEKIVSQSQNFEAQTLLGILYAEEYFSEQNAVTKEDKTAEMRKAIKLLEDVRLQWMNPKKKLSPDSNVLLNLARLYEHEAPEKSLQCLQQVEQMELQQIPDEERPDDAEDEATANAILRESLPPQLINNIAAFQFQTERYQQARELFQSALNGCVKVGDKDDEIDADALVTTISYNLARTYEAEGMLVEARKVYEGLLERHPSYVDARIRLAYILLRQDAQEAGAAATKELMDAYPSNLDVRALYGWYLHRSKKRTLNVAEDQEQRHYKHTLMQFDKHDKYALTGMGNIFLQSAREMRRDTDQDKEKRSKQYQRAVEFFDKALQLDPQNAYAAQGLGIAVVEERKDFSGGIQVFSKVKDSIKDSSVFMNLGHVFCELKQYTRAIENYEIALSRDRSNDPQMLSCLGRVWYFRGKQEKSVVALKTALDYAKSAVETAPDQIHMRFNVAFLQTQIASTIYSQPETARTVADVESAMAGLEEAIELLPEIAKAPNPPFPRHDLEQRANMARNTIRKQLERALQSQQNYENKNAARLEEARKAREAEKQRREEEKQRLAQEEEERRQKLREERARMMEEDRTIAEQKAEEEKIRADAELTTDEETGEKKKREKKKGGKRKKKEDDSGIDSDGSVGDDGGRKTRTRTSSMTPATGDEGTERPKKKKRRKLERKGKVSAKTSSKFKSAEKIVDSDSDDGGAQNDDNRGSSEARDTSPADVEMADEEEAENTQRRRNKPSRIVDDDDDDEEDAEVNGTNGTNGATGATGDSDED